MNKSFAEFSEETIEQFLASPLVKLAQEGFYKKPAAVSVITQVPVPTQE